MNDQIICPHCKKTIPLTQALSHQIQEKYQKFYAQRLGEEKTKIETTLRGELSKKLKNEMEFEMKDKINEVDELRKQNKTQQEQLLSVNRLMRQLKAESEQIKLEMEKKLAKEEERIRVEEKKRLNEEFRLNILEKEKKLQDAIKMNEELKRKLEQGSQQTQGEVLEMELENILQREFPYDEIRPVPKGIVGADIIQIVKNNLGKQCGSIIWESKRTKAWSNEWVSKLKDDQRVAKADIAVLISQILPGTIKHFGFLEGIWVGDYESITGLGLALRLNLIDLSTVKSSNVGKNEKMEVLYNYVSGIEFKHHVEAIVEAFSSMQDDLEKEKRWFVTKWSKQEKNIRRVIDNIFGMRGDLQSIIGKSLAEIKGLQMLPPPKENGKNTLF